MKIGDIVRITDPEEYYDKLYNLQGKIVSIDEDEEFSIEVDLGVVIEGITNSLNGKLPGKTGFPFKESELTLIIKDEIEGMENINAQIGDRVKLCGILDDFNLTGLEATIVKNDPSPTYKWTVKFDKEYVGHTHEGGKKSNEKVYFHIMNQNIAYIINNNKKDMTEEEKAIKEGEMAMKMHYGTYIAPGLDISTYDYLKTKSSEEIKPTTGSLKKRSKRVGFSSIPLKSTI